MSAVPLFVMAQHARKSDEQRQPTRAGRSLPKSGGFSRSFGLSGIFRRVRIPALGEGGDVLALVRRLLGDSVFDALYRQKPRKDGFEQLVDQLRKLPASEGSR